MSQQFSIWYVNTSMSKFISIGEKIEHTPKMPFKFRNKTKIKTYPKKQNKDKQYYQKQSKDKNLP